MACTSCSTSDGGAPKGCKNNGTCGTDSCNKLTVFDWLSNMSAPNGEAPFDCVEVSFKNGRIFEIVALLITEEDIRLMFNGSDLFVYDINNNKQYTVYLD